MQDLAREGTWIINGKEHLRNSKAGRDDVTSTLSREPSTIFNLDTSRRPTYDFDKPKLYEGCHEDEEAGVVFTTHGVTQKLSNKQLPTAVSTRYVDNYKTQLKRKGIQLQNMFGPKRTRTSLSLPFLRSTRASVSSSGSKFCGGASQPTSSLGANVVSNNNNHSKLPVLYIPRCYPSDDSCVEGGSMTEGSIKAPAPTEADDVGDPVVSLKLHMDDVLEEYMDTPGIQTTDAKSSRRLGGVVNPDILQEMSARKPLKMHERFNYYL